MNDPMLISAVTIAVLMLATWLTSVIVKNASIVDIVWGLGFVAVAWSLAINVETYSARQILLAVLVSIWGVRLALYLAKRNIGHGEDWRYKAMRKHHGSKFPLVSLVTVFGLQGVLMWVVSLPVQFGSAENDTPIGPVAVMGILLWIAGFLFETIGDAQLAKFKSDPVNAGKVMNKGLWSLTRHPNYFGDSLMWWGLGVIGAEAGSGIIGLIGPVVMTYLLLKVSGVPMLERSLTKRREGYDEYVARTSAFFPRPPKSL